MKEKDVKMTTRVKETIANKIVKSAEELGLSVYELLRIVLQDYFK